MMMKTSALVMTLASAAVLTACASDTTAPNGDDGVAAEGASAISACPALPAPVYHRVKPANGASLYTLSASEAANAGTSYGFTDNRGTAFYASSGAGTGLVPAYRLYSAQKGDFFWTTSATERSSATAAGYADQGVNFYVSSSAQPCFVPVYRFVNNTLGQHRFAVSATDRNNLAASGWTNEGIRFYAAPEQTTTPPPSGDTKFSFVVIPDTQQEIVYWPGLFTNRVSWIVNNKAAQDFRFVLHTGDMADWDTPDHIHMVRASDGLRPLNNAQIPYAIAPGNHDTAAVCQGGGACPGNVNANLRNTATYNRYFPASSFSNLRGVFEPGKVDNAYHTFQAGGLDWLVLNLELWPRTQVVTWAKSILAAFPKHNVIYITHSHLNSGGGIEQSQGGYGNNSPQYVFDNLLKQYPNVRLVFSGHVGTSAFRQDTGVNGNAIYSFLNCFHDGSTNPTRLVEIDTAAKTLNTRVYAPYNGTSRPDAAKSLTNVTWVK